MHIGESKVKTLNKLASILLIESIALCIVLSYFIIYRDNFLAQVQSTVTLLAFNAIFASLFFHLHGSLNLKLMLLALGNFTGLCWNYIFNSLNIAISSFYGPTFGRICLIVFPFLTSLWIVSFWSLSLTIVRRDNCFTKEL